MDASKRLHDPVSCALLSLISLIFCLAPPYCLALPEYIEDNFIDPDDGMLDASQFLTNNRYGFLPVPSIITEPAVGTGLAMMGLYFHQDHDQDNEEGRILPKNISVFGLGATDNGTKGGGLGHIGFWNDDKLRYLGFLMYPSLNLDFYSLQGVNLPRPVELNIEGPLVFQQIKQRIGDSPFFFGGRQVYRVLDISLANQGQLPLPPAIADNPALSGYLDQHLESSTTTSGLGVLFEYNTVDNPFNPELGYQYSLRYTQFDDAIGSDVDYGQYTFEALNYWHIAENFRLGLRFQFDGIEVDDDERLPPSVPPAIDLRGISATRYQGERVAVGEIELGWQLNPRWKLTTFRGVGWAADSVNDFSDAGSVNSYGAGFRYLIAKRFGFVMGLDIAKGPDDSAIYIQAGSTW